MKKSIRSAFKFNRGTFFMLGYLAIPGIYGLLEIFKVIR